MLCSYQPCLWWWQSKTNDLAFAFGAKEMDARVTMLEKQIEAMQNQIKTADDTIADAEQQKEKHREKIKVGRVKK